MYCGFASPLPMFLMSAALFWPLRYMETLMENFWPRNACVRNSPDKGYHCHDGSGTEYWMW